MAGVLGRFRAELIDSGFIEPEAATLALEWWKTVLTEDDEGGTPDDD